MTRKNEIVHITSKRYQYHIFRKKKEACVKLLHYYDILGLCRRVGLRLLLRTLIIIYCASYARVKYMHKKKEWEGKEEKNYIIGRRGFPSSHVHY